MKVLIYLFPLFFLSKVNGQVYELRGPDNICGNTTFQLFRNGVLNTTPITWLSNSNLQTVSSSNSQIIVSTNASGPVCSFPQGTISVLNGSSQILTYRNVIFLGCTFPITGSNNTLLFGTEGIYNIPTSYVTTGIGCRGYTTWVLSSNLEFTTSASPVNNRKIIVRRIDNGPAFVSFFYGDSQEFKKYILSD